MMPGPRRIGMGADRTARGTRRSEHDRRALIVRLKGVHLGTCAGLPLAPGRLEAGAIACRIVFSEKVAVDENRLLDEIARRRGEYRPPLRVIAVEQGRACPTLERGCELPAEIDGVFKAAVDAIAAIGRMRVGGVAGDEDGPRAIAVGKREAQIPEADMLEADVELGAGRFVKQGLEIEVVARRARGNRGVEEPGAAQIDSSEKLPVAVKRGMQHVVVRLAGIARELLVQTGRAE